MLLWRFFTAGFFQNHPKYEVYLRKKHSGPEVYFRKKAFRIRGIPRGKICRNQRYTSWKELPEYDVYLIRKPAKVEVYLVERNSKTRGIPHKMRKKLRYTSKEESVRFRNIPHEFFSAGRKGKRPRLRHNKHPDLSREDHM